MGGSLVAGCFGDLGFVDGALAPGGRLSDASSAETAKRLRQGARREGRPAAFPRSCSLGDSLGIRCAHP
ncbi:protein of unknown function [Candidatus Filomicrobium marinum]|uniref:Uncharacterized protein n=1 Tax=Candidatus Filomicrobium marinum TaxID=1608628 RepID=A0A0D6JI76_9HYPH|nr:protein of unknown function [Candidatus Filomicrobium marinum]CPR21626.1 protein of unknown function [Candidatus Filomicrobium marinum]